MVGVENQSNSVKALSYVKNKLGINPLLVTCDFSPSLISAIIIVFGLLVLQIDGFHVMQLLNNGIRKDFALFRDKMFRIEIKEFFNLRKWFNEIQNDLRKKQLRSSPIINSPPIIDHKHKNITKCYNFILDFIKLIKIESRTIFEKKIRDKLHNLTKQSNQEPPIQNFCNKIKDQLPQRSITIKGHKRLQNEILKKLKGLCLEFRKPLELEKKLFAKKQWLLFFQPEKLDEERKQMLTQVLEKYPELCEYRELTLQVGSIYRKNVDDITRDEIASLETKSYYSDKLNTAITTLKSHQDSIFRFIEVFKQNPDMGNECRANTEYLNRNFKEPFKNGLSCVGKTHLKAKIGLQMGCEVRWLLPAA